MNNSITPNLVEAAVSGFVTVEDVAILADIANGKLREVEAQRHIIRLIICCADLRHRMGFKP